MDLSLTTGMITDTNRPGPGMTTGPTSMSHPGIGTRGPGRWARLRHRAAHLARPHSHDASDKVDRAMEASVQGTRTLWISLAILGGTAVLQAVVVVFSASVALLGDTIHNAADALTALPLGVAFVAGRRPATQRFTYGFGRAEDLAGIVIVVLIALSAALAALAADGLHARTDGFTSLAVLLGAGGTALGWRGADPVIGLAITAAIVLVLKDAAREVFRRLMDAVDPALLEVAEATLRNVDGVLEVGRLRMRWIGHHLRAEATIVVGGQLSVRAAHQVAVHAEHELMHAVPRLTAALVHADPAPGPDDPHELLAHHHGEPA